ncbi:MAG: cytochrome c [FCB group bacterium]|nr:cytochrome c [FCB group bacterium]MBL7027129.1 cytochrome c [Candidatus Neomarinimicrobiota bacterium]MBL7120636.1 cytochrome c [Candidatus Neomarinimicrobiota bacterium]
MKSFLNILKWTGAVLGILILVLVVFVNIRGNRTYELPLPDLAASSDSAVIARGKYLAFGPAHCVSCHMPMDKFAAVENGLELPLSGGWELNIPPGSFRAPNLTPDMETGIGSFSDGHIARALRYSVRHNGKALFPFMPFQNMSDADVIALISFLRSQPPVKNELKTTELSFLGKAVSAFGMIGPEGPITTPPVWVEIDSTIVYGEYVANAVANCKGCHSLRDLKTGAFIGVDFAGGMPMDSDPMIKGLSFITPNITPHMTDGVMAKWDETTFINRFRAGRVYEGSPMPWGAFSRMSIIELKAVYRYLQSLEPVPGKVDKTVVRDGTTS